MYIFDDKSAWKDCRSKRLQLTMLYRLFDQLLLQILRNTNFFESYLLWQLLWISTTSIVLIIRWGPQSINSYGPRAMHDLQPQIYETNTLYILKQSLIGSKRGLNPGPFDLNDARSAIWATMLRFFGFLFALQFFLPHKVIFRIIFDSFTLLWY